MVSPLFQETLNPLEWKKENLQLDCKLNGQVDGHFNLIDGQERKSQNKSSCWANCLIQLLKVTRLNRLKRWIEKEITKQELLFSEFLDSIA